MEQKCPKCPRCHRGDFKQLAVGLSRCTHCDWLVRIDERGETRDGIDWTRAGRKSGSRRSTETA